MSIYWQYLGASVLKKNHPVSADVFKQFFKLSIPLVEVIWKRLKSRFSDTSPKHLLWTLHLLKSKNPVHAEIAQMLHTNKKTLKTHVIKTLARLFIILPKVTKILLILCPFSFFISVIFLSFSGTFQVDFKTGSI